MIARRKFLSNCSLTAGALLLGRHTATAYGPAALRVDLGASGHKVSPDFIGLSYENMQLEDSTFFSAKNTSLVSQFKAISTMGVLRLGGNTSEFSWWQADASQAPPERRLTLKNGTSPQSVLYAISPQTILELDGFLRATGWTCIYGLNLGFGTPGTDLPEAEFVHRTLGPRLRYFQIGNEVDNFPQYNLRDAVTWSPSAYLKQWLTIARAVQKAIPEAQFGLPDVASSVDWLTAIASEWSSVADKPRITTLSHHYYWSGPPSNPNASVARLLRPDPVVLQKASITRYASLKLKTDYRMTEGNTVYRGGKSGLSDVFASALWAADYLLLLMRLGYSGVNLHGGSGHAQAVSVGGTFVGESEMPNPDQPHPKPFYTPIANEGTLAGHGVEGKLTPGYVLEPCGYGMMFASAFAGASMLPVDFDPGTINATAYAARRPDGKVMLAIINKDEAHQLTLHVGSCALVQVLTAPSLLANEAHILVGRSADTVVTLDYGVLQVPRATGAIVILKGS